ncbi:MAG TPA: glutathione S-transferase family protein [Candidatus Udaeobacter sp.]|nr:glutathione S-transferase family protein [Candidatus Udaeobacter sp.]
MKLYSGPLSLFGHKAEIALNEKGIAFERIMVPFSQTQGYSPKHPAVLAANPKAQVPVLVDSDLTLFDSTVIFEYLEDAYPTPPLYPAEAKARARCRLMELTADEILVPIVVKLGYRTEPPAGDPVRQAAREAEGRRADAALFDRFATMADELEGREYLCGGFSVADITMFMTVLFSQRLGGPRLAAHPALARWYERVGSRPAPAKAAAEIAAADRELSRPLAG